MSRSNGAVVQVGGGGQLGRGARPRGYVIDQVAPLVRFPLVRVCPPDGAIKDALSRVYRRSPVVKALVQEALARLQEGRAVVVVAHRLSTVVGADEVVVLEGGAVRERGAHAELVARGGLYASLVNAQHLVVSGM